jgi:predicted dehydrogenase
VKRVKVFGAGSIGNHLANASRRKGWAVDICDVDPAALKRTREMIYPGRYGVWDEAIGLHNKNSAPVGGYDLIVVGTPPDSHMSLAREAVKEKPVAILIEKPVCTPDLNGAQALHEEAAAAGVKLFVGYDHAVGKSAQLVSGLLGQQAVGKLDTLDVEFREFWGGIFAAHPWLSGPADSYLGYWRRGGGACGEHSHAINLWQSFAHAAGAGRIVEVSANLQYVSDGKMDYDKLCLLEVRTENGLLGRVVQDVVTRPTRKWARAQGAQGAIEWLCGAKPNIDTVIVTRDAGEVSTTDIHKTRPDDFIEELSHIESVLAVGEATNSPIAIERGLDSMLVVTACHKSSAEKRTIRIDYSRGYTEDTLK